MRPHRRALLTGAAAVTALSVLPAHAAAADYAEALDAVFADRAPVALAGDVATRDGLAWSGVRGVRQFGRDDPVTLDDRWHLGSNTKAMTAALYARLVEQGRADWDAPLAALFPGLTIDPGWTGVTIEAFLRHRAGVKDVDALGPVFFMTARADPRPLPEQRRTLVEAMLSRPPSGPPGRYEYANANYVLAGAAIERLTSGSWEDAMRAEVFAPLGLTSAGFGAPVRSVGGGANAWGHRGSGSSRVAMDPGDPDSDNPGAMGPANAAHMTLEDYARWLRVFLTEGGDWLKPETVARLTAPASGDGPPYASGWIVREGLPWAGDGPALLHEGSNTLWHAAAGVAPARGVAFIGLCNEGMAAGAANGLIPGLIGAFGR